MLEAWDDRKWVVVHGYEWYDMGLYSAPRLLLLKFHVENGSIGYCRVINVYWKVLQ